jgi:VanZ family protein
VTDRRWLPPLLWAAVILTATSIPNPSIPNPARADLLAHFGMYGVLGFLLARAPAAPRARTLVMLALGASLFGAVDEYHQRFIPGRFASVDDWAADSLGAALGVLAFAAARKRREPTT